MYPNRLGISLPVVGDPTDIPIVGGIVKDIPIIGGIFGPSGMCPPVMPGTVSSYCRNQRKHFFAAPTGPGGQLELWHTGRGDEGSSATPMFRRLVKNGEDKWMGFHGVTDWMPWDDSRVPQMARDYWTSIRTTGGPPTEPSADLGPAQPTAAGVQMGAAVPLLLGAGLLFALMRK